jgi:hypothetical protein
MSLSCPVPNACTETLASRSRSSDEHDTATYVRQTTSRQNSMRLCADTSEVEKCVVISLKTFIQTSNSSKQYLSHQLTLHSAGFQRPRLPSISFHIITPRQLCAPGAPTSGNFAVQNQRLRSDRSSIVETLHRRDSGRKAGFPRTVDQTRFLHSDWRIQSSVWRL